MYSRVFGGWFSPDVHFFWRTVSFFKKSRLAFFSNATNLQMKIGAAILVVSMSDMAVFMKNAGRYQ